MSAMPLADPALAPTALPLDLQGIAVDLGGAPVLRGIDAALPAGRTLALLGPSGCGKTTLLRVIAGLQAPDRGRVVLGGTDVTDVRAEQRGVGMVFQDGALFPHLSVAENVGFGLPRGRRRGPEVREVLAMVGLQGFEDRMPATLSGGQQQRVALARALVTRPRVLLLDEPFSALDAGLRVQVRAEVAALLRELGITAVVVTHDQEEAFLLGDEVAVMFDGRIHQQGAPAEVYAAPASREVARFLGDANLLRGWAQGGVARTWVGDIPLRDAASGPVEVLIRPEDLRVRTAPGGGGAVVCGVAYYGHDAVTTVRGPEGTLAIRTLARPAGQVGDPLELAYDGPAAVAYPVDLAD